MRRELLGVLDFVHYVNILIIEILKLALNSTVKYYQK
jgi:hypothetical protein